MSFEEARDLTALEYARHYGLALDHLAERLPLLDISALQQEDGCMLTSDSHLPCNNIPIYINTDDRLTTDQRCALLLAEVHGTRSYDVDSVINSLLDERIARNLHVELPLLRTDHEEDLRTFAEWDQPFVDEGSLPHEVLNIELDQGLEWPTFCKTLPADVTAECQGQTVEFSKDTVFRLVDLVTDRWNEEDESVIWESMSLYKRVPLIFSKTNTNDTDVA
jgi:hypothetical protein